MAMRHKAIIDGNTDMLFDIINSPAALSITDQSKKFTGFRCK